jgi:hypothetical protein
MEDKSLNKHPEKRKEPEKPYSFLSTEIQAGQGQLPYVQRKMFFCIPKRRQTFLQPKG